jgi:type II secretory pathway pseudopilin PulG
MKARLRAKRDGFTLVELMVVLGIIIVLGTLSMAAIPAIQGSTRAGQAMATLVTSLEQVRQISIAENTYSWVAFRDNRTTRNLSVMMIASKDGTASTIPWDSPPLDVGTSPDLKLLAPVQNLERVALALPGEYKISKIQTTVPGFKQGGTANRLRENAPSMTLRNPSNRSNAPFRFCFRFSSTGQPQVAEAPINFIDIPIVAYRGTVLDENNFGLIRIHGLTGLATLYRPGVREP